MKFTKLGKALAMSALSAGLILGISSCVQSYTVGFLYVTGTATVQSGNNGIISGFRIDHNTGYLLPINQFPVASGGSNPIRAVLLPGSRFLYVLNRGVNAAGNADCYGTSGNTVCQNANITQFALGGNGILTPQETFYTEGLNPFRLISDTAGGYLLALDHDAPDPTTCQLALGAKVTSCADVTVFKIDSTTGRLSLVTDAQVTSASGKPLNYFPVPANPIDFTMAPGFLLTLSGTPATGDAVFPYAYSGASGQLTFSQNTSQPLDISQGTTIENVGGSVYIPDNEPPSPNPNNSVSQILIFTLGTAGALQAQTGGIVPDDPTLADPIWVLQESKGKFIYVANAANNPANTSNPYPDGGITGYSVTTSPTFQLTFTSPSTFGTGAGPQCMVEDPSDQYVYTANLLDSTVTGRLVDPNAGVLNTLTRGSKFNLAGPPTWCLIDGRTD
jgi:hypothetical protein